MLWQTTQITNVASCWTNNVLFLEQLSSSLAVHTINVLTHNTRLIIHVLFEPGNHIWLPDWNPSVIIYELCDVLFYHSPMHIIFALIWFFFFIIMAIFYDFYPDLIQLITIIFKICHSRNYWWLNFSTPAENFYRSHSHSCKDKQQWDIFRRTQQEKWGVCSPAVGGDKAPHDCN